MRLTAAFRPATAAAILALTFSASCGAGGSENTPAPNASSPEVAQAPIAEASAPAPATEAAPAVDPQGPRMVVYKTPTCGCCRAWVEHAQAAGFQVVVRDTSNVDPVKQEHGVPGHLASCHTALVDGYVIEGHVPMEAVKRLLREKPQNIAGLAVPGMPRGSEGMEMGNVKDPYDVIAMGRGGGVSVYSSH
ncbi:MAG TPA: DUF411 domain-containing protein [Longimicrobium sp.]|jgi:hypothetical protein|uniref:DUF411 domain-containing protein n=1 Tax=Longimicrobium sp. TaxID=2029185 RepID=UPI002EDA71C8